MSKSEGKLVEKEEQKRKVKMYKGTGAKSKARMKVPCYQCGREGYKKPDCKYYKAELERKKNIGEKKKMDSENERRRKWTENESHNKEKDKEKANVASSFIIEEPSYVEDILCTTMAADHAEVNDISNYIHAQECRLEGVI